MFSPCNILDGIALHSVNVCVLLDQLDHLHQCKKVKYQILEGLEGQQNYHWIVQAGRMYVGTRHCRYHQYMNKCCLYDQAAKMLVP